MRALFLIFPAFPLWFTPCIAQEFTAEQVFEKVSPSVLTVYAFSGNKIHAQGSGVILKDRGWVVTNYHVFSGGDRIVLKQGDKVSHQVSIIGADVEKDLMILRFTEDWGNTLLLGDWDSLRVGQKTYAIGSPLGYENTLSEGIVSGLRVNDQEGGENLIQTTAPISPGSSGGALVDSRGRLIGISTQASKGGQNLNFALPVSLLSGITVTSSQDNNQLLVYDYSWKAKSAMEGGDLPQAMHYFHEILSMDSSYNPAYINLSRCYSGQADPDSAFFILHLLYERDSLYAPLEGNLGVLFGKQGAFDKALPHFRKAVKLDPGYAPGYHNLGVLYGFLEAYDSSVYYLKKAVEINPQYANAYLSLGITYVFKGALDEAIKNYQKVIDLDPERPNAYSSLADAYVQKKDYTGAIDLLQAAIRTGIRSGEVYYGLGEAYFFLGMTDQAIENFVEVLSYREELIREKGLPYGSIINAGSCYFLYLIYESRHDKARAKEYKQETFSLMPEWKKMKSEEILTIIK